MLHSDPPPDKSGGCPPTRFGGPAALALDTPGVVTVRGVLDGVVSTFSDDGDAGTAVVWLRDDAGRRHKVVAEDCDIRTLEVGQRFQAVGVIEDDRYGRQLRGVLSFDPASMDLTGLRVFLAKCIDGVGATLARKLVDAFGCDVVRVLRDTDRAVDDGILRPEVAREAQHYLRGEAAEILEATAELYQLLAQTRAQRWHRYVKRLLRRHRHRAACELRERPFEVCLQALIPFRLADALHLLAGGDPAFPDRHLAALREAMASDKGATWNLAEDLPDEMKNGRGEKETLDWKLAARTGIGREVFSRGELTGERPAPVLALGTRARDEIRLATAVRHLQSTPFPWPEAARIGGVSKHQRQEVAAATAAAVGILDGAAGTGKSHTAAALIRAAVAAGISVRVACPTGKAAQRQREFLSGLGLPVQPVTIHRLLGAVPSGDADQDDEDDGCAFRFAHDRTNPLERGLYVIDEASMLDCALAAMLFDALPPGSGVLLLGDSNQLPSVSHGMVLRDLIAAGVPRGHLTQQHRQGGGVLLATLDAIREGAPLPALPGELRQGRDLVLLDAAGQDARLRRLPEALDWLEAQGLPPGAVQVVAYSNALCAFVNAQLQHRWNPSGDAEDTPGRPREGDRVINRRNRFLPAAGPPRRGQAARVFVANGEQGLLEGIAPGRDRAAVVRLDTGERVATRIPWKGVGKLDRDGVPKGPPQKFNEWSLAYCITCHRAQGSEWPAVVVMLEDNPNVDRAWAYTAISRARKAAVVLGTAEQLRAALGRLNSNLRITRLQQHLGEP